MDFYDVLKNRRSIRGFDSTKDIPEEALQHIMLGEKVYQEYLQ